MTKLEIALTKMQSSDATFIDIQKIKRISVSFDHTEPLHFELLGWESVKGSKTFRLELPIQYYDEVVCEIPKIKIEHKEAIDIFDEFEKVGKKW